MVVVDVRVSGTTHIPLNCRWLLWESVLDHRCFPLFVGFWHKVQLFCIVFVHFPEKVPHWASGTISLGSLVVPFSGNLVSFLSLVIPSHPRQFCPLPTVTSSKPASLLPLARASGPTCLRLALVSLASQFGSPQRLLNSLKIAFFENIFAFSPGLIFSGLLWKGQKSGKSVQLLRAVW